MAMYHAVIAIRKNMKPGNYAVPWFCCIQVKQFALSEKQAGTSPPVRLQRYHVPWLRIRIFAAPVRSSFCSAKAGSDRPGQAGTSLRPGKRSVQRVPSQRQILHP